LDAVCVGDSVPDPEWVGDELSVPELEAVLLTDPVSEAVLLTDPVPDTDAVEETDAELLAEPLTEPVPVVVREGVIVRLPVEDTVPDFVMLVVAEVVELTVQDRVAVLEGVPVVDLVPVLEDETERDAVLETVGEID
jgi:hypothetical protein